MGMGVELHQGACHLRLHGHGGPSHRCLNQKPRPSMVVRVFVGHWLSRHARISEVDVHPSAGG